MAELGGITAITGFAFATGILRTLAAALILASSLLAILGVFLAVQVSVGKWRPQTLLLGPDVALLQRAVDRHGGSAAETRVMLLATLADLFGHNAAAIAIRMRLLVAASYLMAGAAALFMTAVLFIIGGGIRG